MNKLNAFCQWSSILILIAAWEILGHADEMGYAFLHPITLFGFIAAIWSAIAFVLLRNDDALVSERESDE